MSADANTVVHRIDNDALSPTLSNTETESDNSIRYGDETSPTRIERPIKDEPMDVDETMEEDNDDELDDEEAEEATGMFVTMMELLDPDSVVAMQLSNATIRKLVTENCSSFALRHIERAVLTKDYAQLSTATDEVGISLPSTMRMERTHVPTMAALVEWFFRALQKSFVEQLKVDDVPVDEAFVMCLQKYAPTIRVTDFSCDKVTLQFQAGVSYPLQVLFEHFASVETVDLGGCYGLLDMNYDEVIAASTANPRITSLHLPNPNSGALGATMVSSALGSTMVDSKVLIDFCFHQSTPGQRAVRVLDVYAPTVDQNFLQKIIGRYYTNQGNAQVMLNVHHPIPTQDLEVVYAHAQIRDDGMRLRIVDDEDTKILQISLLQGWPSTLTATDQSPAPSVVVVPPVKSES